MGVIEDFIKAYKDLEAALQKRNKSIFGIEKTLPPDDSKKMQLCRLTRNFLQHETEEFVKPTEYMTAFLTELKDRISGKVSEKDTVSSILYRIRPMTLNDAFMDAAKVVGKNGYIPIVDADGCFQGMFTTEVMKSAMFSGASNKLLSAVKLKRPEQEDIVSPDTLYAHLPEGLYVVTEDGSPTGKYVGMAEKKNWSN